MSGKKRTYRSSIKHLIYNLKKLQFSINKRGGKIPIDLCICRYRLEEFAKFIELMERKGYKVTKEGLEWDRPAHIQREYTYMRLPLSKLK